MFKKLLSGIMAIAVCVVGLSGCGESPPDEMTSETTTEVTTAKTTTAEVTTDAAEDGESDQNEAEAGLDKFTVHHLSGTNGNGK